MTKELEDVDDEASVLFESCLSREAKCGFCRTGIIAAC